MEKKIISINLDWTELVPAYSGSLEIMKCELANKTALICFEIIMVSRFHTLINFLYFQIVAMYLIGNILITQIYGEVLTIFNKYQKIM